MGAKAVFNVVQLDFPGRVFRGPPLASLAGGGAGRVFVSGLERIFIANDLYGDRDFAETTSTHDGSGCPIDGQASADDAGSVDRWVADHPIWMGRRGQAGIVGLRWAG